VGQLLHKTRQIAFTKALLLQSLTEYASQREGSLLPSHRRGVVDVAVVVVEGQVPHVLRHRTLRISALSLQCAANR
jgi:hypothetical protein